MKEMFIEIVRSLKEVVIVVFKGIKSQLKTNKIKHQ